MPQVGTKHFAYTKAGYTAAARARKKKSRVYAKEQIAMARKLIK